MHDGKPTDLVAEFGDERALARAVRAMREAGYQAVDVHMPFADDEVMKALDPPASPLAGLTLAGGLVGATGAYLLQWWTQAVDYPLNVGGRPDHAAPAFIPITFETGVLFAALFAFFGWLALAGLPKLWRPIFEVPGFASASIDGWWIRIDASDPRFDPDRTTAELLELGPLRIERVGGGS
ncbi:MAG: DUF3341 domain-containing protein [Myxococcota bacterium]